MTFCSCESRATDTTISFASESSLTGSIVQTWAATTGILLEEKVEISPVRLVSKLRERVLLNETVCKSFKYTLNVYSAQQITN